MVDLFKMIIHLGYCNALIPEKGSAGLDFLSRGLLLEELAMVYPSLAIPEMGQTLIGRTAMLNRPKEIKDRHLPRMIANELI
jgi:alkylation response protein AidB-like acyl-CoA dehydrogenase